MKSACALLLLSLVAINAISLGKRPKRQSEVCSLDEWISRVDGVEYAHYSSHLTYDDAEEICRQCGAAVASVHNQEESDYLSAVIGDHTFWLGAKDSDVEGTFTWADGSALDFNLWNKNEPDNIGSDNEEGDADCMYVSLKGEWKDHRCSSKKKPFVCQRGNVFSTAPPQEEEIISTDIYTFIPSFPFDSDFFTTVAPESPLESQLEYTTGSPYLTTTPDYTPDYTFQDYTTTTPDYTPDYTPQDYTTTTPDYTPTYPAEYLTTAGKEDTTDVPDFVDVSVPEATTVQPEPETTTSQPETTAAPVRTTTTPTPTTTITTTRAPTTTITTTRAPTTTITTTRAPTTTITTTRAPTTTTTTERPSFFNRIVNSAKDTFKGWGFGKRR